MTALFCWSSTAQNSNGVTVSNLAVNAGTVTFNVSWQQPMPVEPWSDTVWVFVDYNDAGKMERLPLSGASLTSPSWAAASVTFGKDGNNKGAWVVGNARSAGSFSATVQLLTAVADLSGVCAYASNYPPVGEYIDATHLSFTGTLPYYLVLASAESGARTYSINDSYYNLYGGDTLKSFTDKTGAPGIFHCIPPAAPTVAKGEFCYEQSGALVAAAPSSVSIVWYDAPSAGNLLHTGNILSLAPLYNSTAQYYAEAALNEYCRSVRTKADYTVSNCIVSGDCPNYTAGNVGSNTAPAACMAHYAGQIGSAAISLSCMAHDAGRIGN
jgi:hypothetical protein